MMIIRQLCHFYIICADIHSNEKSGRNDRFFLWYVAFDYVGYIIIIYIAAENIAVGLKAQ